MVTYYRYSGIWTTQYQGTRGELSPQGTEGFLLRGVFGKLHIDVDARHLI